VGARRGPLRASAKDALPLPFTALLADLAQIAPAVTGVRADGRKVPFEDDSCDVVLAGFYLNHLRRPLDGVVEIRRVLRRGGRFVTAVWDHPDHARHNGAINEAVKATLGYMPAVPAPDGPALTSCQALAALMRAGGLVSVKARRSEQTTSIASPMALLELAAASTARSSALLDRPP
jgi:SAM-dependent methyltransferase